MGEVRPNDAQAEQLNAADEQDKDDEGREPRRNALRRDEPGDDLKYDSQDRDDDREECEARDDVQRHVRE